MRYIVIHGTELEFIGALRLMLDAGWKPQGGVAVARIPPGVIAESLCGSDSVEFLHGGVELFQAMTHDDDNAEIPEAALHLC